jgi:hypothetical protein
MAYQEKFSGDADKTVALVNKGDSIEGYFIGSKEIESEYGMTKLHIFQTKEGNIGVWGKTHLNKLLTPDLLGMMCFAEFTGMIQPKKKGRKPAYGYKVKFDPDKKVPINNALPKSVSEEEGDASFEVERF